MYNKFIGVFILLAVASGLAISCSDTGNKVNKPYALKKIKYAKEVESFNPDTEKERFQLELAKAAVSIVDESVVYDPSYISLKYPGGDVASNKGVCTDVLVRAYRKLGIDLQKEVHEDMKSNFGVYPKKWGLRGPDTNIDHRRVPNLQKFFERKGETLAVTKDPDDYKPGDIVTWVLDNGLVHSGIVSDKLVRSNERYIIVHNIGRGQILEDMLFDFKITGHYRYYGN